MSAKDIIGEANGYSILLSAKACGPRILALSATLQLHASKRLEELKKVFDRIEILVEDREIRQYIPEGVVYL